MVSRIASGWLGVSKRSRLCWSGLPTPFTGRFMKLDMPYIRIPIGCLLLLACPPPAAGLRVAEATDFSSEVRPILEKHCFECHGNRKQESGLRLDLPQGIRAGGDSGPALVPGKASESLLLKRVTGTVGQDRMPPEGPGLTAAEIDTLRAWIAAGGDLPADAPQTAAPGKHWSYQPIPIVVPPVPDQKAAARGPIDFFIVDRLEAVGRQQQRTLAMSPEAPRATLLRRLNLDLRGLPPELDASADWTSTAEPDEWEREVDRQLASLAFGEKWGRWWLDQARYADSNGYTRDFGREIWPYREWVIKALNADHGFDRFTVEQLAGDLLPQPTQDQFVATGFHRNTLVNEEGGTDQEQFRVEAVADRVATTGSVWLGLTLGCARCHNHKYDPISQREFYQFFAFLNNCDEPSLEVPTQSNHERGDLARRDEIRRQIAELDSRMEQQREALETAQRAWETTVTPEQRARLPGPVQVAYDMPFEKRDATNKKLIEDYYRVSPQGREKFPELDQIARLRDSEPKIPTTLILRERPTPRDTFLHKRGDFLNPGVQVFPQTPATLHPLLTTHRLLESADPPRPPSGGEASGEASGPTRRQVAPDRLQLARWLVDAENPLTPRVIANRVWLPFYGRGLVETDDDFGTQGLPATHPELLNWLARSLLGHGGNSPWSIKRFQRNIVLSAVYRQSSTRRVELAEVDPRNDLLARQTRLRVDAEIVRDLALAVSGLLTQRLGGPSVMPPQPEGVYAFTQDPKPWKAATGGDRYRRGVYTFFWRSLPYPMLSTFDAPNANVTCTRRLRSNTPLQSLTLANDLAFFECAQQLARQIVGAASASREERAGLLFRSCLGREPTSAERVRLDSLIEQQVADVATDLQGWTAVCRVLLNLDEFITRE